MEKHFATYTQSLALKELGFDESCLSEFWKRDDGELFPISGNELFELKYQKERTSNVDDMTFVINRPLKSQVFEWFREKYNLISCIRTISYGCTIDEQEFYCEIVSVRGVSSYSLHNKFEEAESECIDKLIEIVKNK